MFALMTRGSKVNICEITNRVSRQPSCYVLRAKNIFIFFLPLDCTILLTISTNDCLNFKAICHM